MVRTGVPDEVRLGVWTARAWNVPIACARHEGVTKRKSLTVWRTRRAAPCGGAEPRCDAIQMAAPRAPRSLLFWGDIQGTKTLIERTYLI